MFQYRITHHANSFDGNFRCNLGVPAEGYLTPSAGTFVQGWVLSRLGPLDSLKIQLIDGQRRDLVVLESFIDSPDLHGKFPGFEHTEQARFRFDIGRLEPILSGRDCAIELVASVSGLDYSCATLTLVRDQLSDPAVFIIGSPRSGTTALHNSLGKTLGCQNAYGECHVLPLADSISDLIEKYGNESKAVGNPGMFLHHVNLHLLSDQMLGSLKALYSQSFANGWIIDKTPGNPMLRSLPVIQKLWPDAHFIFAKRRGLENITSRLKKFPDVPFEVHCRQWKVCMNKWRLIRGRLRNSIEIDQFDLAMEPEHTVEQLGNFLGLGDAKKTEFVGNLLSHWPEGTQPSKHKKGRALNPRQLVAPLSLDTMPWTNDEKAIFTDYCGEMMTDWGYSLDDRYYLEQIEAVA